MKKIVNPGTTQIINLLKRPVAKRNDLEATVKTIFAAVKKDADKALKKYTKQFDNAVINSFIVDEKTIAGAADKLSPALKAAIQLAKKNITIFHTTQKEKVQKTETTKGVFCWRENRAIEKVGLYIPGGTAPLFSTVLMLGIPAVLAGCKEIILCTPPDKNGEINPAILYAANLVGIKGIYSVGGIQAIAGLCFGTESIPQVFKIFGPGNQYVTAAKQMALQYNVAIDMPAGPSEVLIIADKKANASFVAADLLAQAEHGADSQVILLSDNEKITDKILTEIKKQVAVLPRKNIALQALKNSTAIVLNNITDCITLSNFYAPEHLIIATEKPLSLVKKITNAGSVFLGKYSCESAGDYASGTNHTLPTNGYARNYSGVSLDSFVKKITFQEITKEGINNIGPAIALMAEAEHLYAHKNAVTVRLNN